MMEKDARIATLKDENAVLRARLAAAEDRGEAAARYLSAETQRSATIEAEVERLRRQVAPDARPTHTTPERSGMRRATLIVHPADEQRREP